MKYYLGTGIAYLYEVIDEYASLRNAIMIEGSYNHFKYRFSLKQEENECLVKKLYLTQHLLVEKGIKVIDKAKFEEMLEKI